VTARIAVLTLVALATALAGCGKGGPPAPAGPSATARTAPDPDRAWTAEEISGDPQGYMTWADAKIQRQVSDREKRQKSLSARLAEVRLRQRNLDQSIRDVENLCARMKAAMQRAEDEDRWPLKLGGRSFSAGQAGAVIAQTQKYVEDRRPLLGAYDGAVARLEDAERALRKDIEALQSLRERLALDLERVRLNVGMEELGVLRETESEIAGYARALGQMADESLIMASLPPGDKDAAVDANSFLNPAQP